MFHKISTPISECMKYLVVLDAKDQQADATSEI